MSLLLPVDTNDPVEDLLVEASEWARRLGTTLDLVYVDPYPYTSQDPVVQNLLAAEWRERHLEREAWLRALLEALPEERRGNTSVRLGRPAEEIVEAGRNHTAILIAAHGRRTLSERVLGSVAERVVRTSTVPVIVLPRRA
jgi:nucleotide-binding universal stress UspA family protein